MVSLSQTLTELLFRKSAPWTSIMGNVRAGIGRVGNGIPDSGTASAGKLGLSLGEIGRSGAFFMRVSWYVRVDCLNMVCWRVE